MANCGVGSITRIVANGHATLRSVDLGCVTQLGLDLKAFYWSLKKTKNSTVTWLSLNIFLSIY